MIVYVLLFILNSKEIYYGHYKNERDCEIVGQAMKQYVDSYYCIKQINGR